MKKSFFQYHLLLTSCLFLIILPFNFLLIPSIVLLIISWLANDSFKEKFDNLRSRPYFWVLISPYLIYVLGMIHTDNQLFGWKDLETKLSLFLFPLILASTTYDFYKLKKIVFSCFSMSVTTVGVISFLNGLMEFKTIPTYNQLDLFQHPSYLSMYFNLAALLSFYLIKTYRSKKLQLVMTTCLITQVVLIYFCQSKSGLITFLILFIYSLPFKHLLKYRWQSFSAILLIGIGGFFLLQTEKVKRFNERLTNFQYFSFELDSIDPNTTESFQVRYLIWNEAINLFKEHPLIGVGTGDIKDEMIKRYDMKGMSGALNARLNVHNQFLQVAAALGLIGLLVFIGVLLTAVRLSFKQEEGKLLFGFIIIASINMLFESLLEKQMGVIFIAFFLSFFVFHIKEKSAKNPSNSFQDQSKVVE